LKLIFEVLGVGDGFGGFEEGLQGLRCLKVGIWVSLEGWLLLKRWSIEQVERGIWGGFWSGNSGLEVNSFLSHLKSMFSLSLVFTSSCRTFVLLEGFIFWIL